MFSERRRAARAAFAANSAAERRGTAAGGAASRGLYRAYRRGYVRASHGLCFLPFGQKEKVCALCAHILKGQCRRIMRNVELHTALILCAARERPRLPLRREVDACIRDLSRQTEGERQ